jgi:hypothetical protein
MGMVKAPATLRVGLLAQPMGWSVALAGLLLVLKVAEALGWPKGS